MKFRYHVIVTKESLEVYEGKEPIMEFLNKKVVLDDRAYTKADALALAYSVWAYDNTLKVECIEEQSDTFTY